MIKFGNHEHISILTILLKCFNQGFDRKKDDSKTQLDKNFEKELAIGLCFFFCFYVGAEMTFSNFIYSFGICHLKMSRDSATVLTTTFWVLFTVFRFLSAIQECS